MTAQKRKKSCREDIHILREYINNHVQYICRNTEGKGHSDEVSGVNKEHVIEQWKKAILIVKWQKS